MYVLIKVHSLTVQILHVKTEVEIEIMNSLYSVVALKHKNLASFNFAI